MRYLFIALLAILTSCSKDDIETINGTYSVMVDDNRGHTPHSETLTIQGNLLTIKGMNKSIKITPSGNTFTVDKGQSAAYKGSGIITGNTISADIWYNYGGGIDKFSYYGSK